MSYPAPLFPPNMRRYVGDAVIRAAQDRHPHLPLTASYGICDHMHVRSNAAHQMLGARGTIHLNATGSGIQIGGTGWPATPRGLNRQVCSPPITVPYPDGGAAEILSRSYRAAVDHVIAAVAGLIGRTREEYEAYEEAADRAVLTGACSDELR